MRNYVSFIAFFKFYPVADCNRIGGTESLEAKFAPDPAFCEFPIFFSYQIIITGDFITTPFSIPIALWFTKVRDLKYISDDCAEIIAESCK